jgi:hypothetical protein
MQCLRQLIRGSRTHLPTYLLPTHPPTYLWFYSPFLGLGRFFSFLIFRQVLGLIRWGISPLQGRFQNTVYLNFICKSTYRNNKYTVHSYKIAFRNDLQLRTSFYVSFFQLFISSCQILSVSSTFINAVASTVYQDNC